MERKRGPGSRHEVVRTSVRLDAELWALIQLAADRAGVSVSEYIRQAASARARSDMSREREEPGERSVQAGSRPMTAAGVRDDAAALLAQSHQAVHHARELLEATIREHRPEATHIVFRMSPDWREWRKLSGRWPVKEPHPASRSWIDSYVHADDRTRVAAVVEQAIASQNVIEAEHRVVCEDGAVRWVYSRALPLFGNAGELTEWLCVVSGPEREREPAAVPARARS